MIKALRKSLFHLKSRTRKALLFVSKQIRVLVLFKKTSSTSTHNVKSVMLPQRKKSNAFLSMTNHEVMSKKEVSTLKELNKAL
jgi:hypothetical protein